MALKITNNMLPDYPKLKRKLLDQLLSRMEAAERLNMGIFSQIPITKIFEGNRDILIREDGTVEETQIKRIEATFEYNLAEIETLTLEEIEKKIDSIAIEISKQKMEMTLETIDKAVKKVGNFMDFKGKPFTIDNFFEVLAKMWIEFDEFERPELPPIVSGEKAYAALNRVLPQLESDENAKKKFSDLIDQKRREWRARENNRKLVD